MKKKKNLEIRTGLGFDAHKFVSHKKNVEKNIWLGGIQIPSEYAIDAHSDGDVLIHSIVDAILGAIGEGDIGVHFPPSDLKWKNCDSKVFLKYASNCVKKKSGVILNIDSVVICEEPKISPYRELIKAKISEVLEIDPNRVNVKGTTTEKMGFTGRKEGIAANAVVTISRLI